MRLQDIPDIIPVVGMTDELGMRLRKALFEVEATGDEAVEDLLWEAEVAHAHNDRVTLVAALELLGF